MSIIDSSSPRSLLWGRCLIINVESRWDAQPHTKHRQLAEALQDSQRDSPCDITLEPARVDRRVSRHVAGVGDSYSRHAGGIIECGQQGQGQL